MIKNTNEKMSIKNVKLGKRIFLTSSIALSTLCLSIPVKATDMSDPFNDYASVYLDASKKVEGDTFDPVFEKFYESGVVDIDDNEYQIDDLYVKTMEDDKNYLTKAGEQIDLLTLMPLEGEKKATKAFRKTSFLYDIYTDGYINDNTLTIDKDKLQEYIDNWDLKEHSEVKGLKIEQEAGKEYHEQYGKRR